MNLTSLVDRTSIPEPWAEGDNIPWNAPEFSARMLSEHLSQDHDLASRRSEVVDRQVAWIHKVVLGGKPSRILDLGCGPGLYAVRLARLGHSVAGIDYAPAAVAYASQQAKEQGLDCTFVQQDIRLAEYGGGFDLVMQIYGELNVFRPQDARLILRKAREALKPGGVLLLEASYFSATEQGGHEPPTWFTSSGGLFNPGPHLGLVEHFWDSQDSAATTRFYIVDLGSGEVMRCAQSMQAYREDDYRTLLAECGFVQVQILPGIALEQGDPPDPEFCALIGRAEA